MHPTTHVHTDIDRGQFDLDLKLDPVRLYVVAAAGNGGSAEQSVRVEGGTGIAKRVIYLRLSAPLRFSALNALSSTSSPVSVAEATCKRSMQRSADRRMTSHRAAMGFSLGRSVAMKVASVS